MIRGRVPNKGAVVDRHRCGVTVDGSAGISAVIREGAVPNRMAPAIGIQRATAEVRGVRIKGAVGNGKDRTIVATGYPAAAEEPLVAGKLALADRSRAPI